MRILKKKNTFEKGYTNRFTTELFLINAIYHTNPITYEIEDLKNEIIEGKFYEWELLSSNEVGEYES